MVENLFIPKLGMTMEKATIAEWKFNHGDKVNTGDVVLVIDTEKVAHEIEAPVSGYLVVMAAVGEEKLCGEVIGKIAETKEEFDAEKNLGGGAPQASSAAGATGGSELAEKQDVSEKEKTTDGTKRIFISPAAKKLAEMNNIDIRNVAGSGPNGRIEKKDIEKAMNEKPAAAAAPQAKSSLPAPPVTASPAAASSTVIDGKKVKSVIPLRGMRKVISDHMRYSLDTSARVTTFGEADMTKMIALRKRYLEKEAVIGCRLTFTDLFIFMTAKALKSVPILNSSLIGDEIKLWDDINVGFAVSVFDRDQGGLVVPVIRNADRLTLGEIARTRKDLTDRARNGKLAIDEMMGGTFTITNTGTFAPVWHIQTPIINQPQSAILGTSSIVDKPMVENGEIVIRPMMPISFTFDHRVMDGAPVAQFLVKIGEMIMDPEMMVV